MKNVFFLAAFAAFSSLFGQTEKAAMGAQPLQIPQSAFDIPHSTRAVVVGISDYQSAQIPDLKFAERDALAFSDFLKSEAGGRVPTENIRLLLNEKARNAQLVADLDGLAEDAREGDLCVIYFSGHGDVETKTRGQFGFLLAWDSPPTNYKAGAYPLIFLQDIVSTIIDKKARVIVIADACHAGKLAGSTIGGTQATAQTLAQQYSSEVKILSCQPNELSLEGEQWGGGRGAFSYNLIKGLRGLADKNRDRTVNLYEIDRFLGEVVPAETAPHSQIPMVVGDKQFVLAAVDSATLEAEKRLLPDAPFAQTGGRGMADGLLAAEDSALLALFHRFEKALERGPLLGSDSSADAFFEQLSKAEKLASLHGLMRRNFAAALQNEPQQALNAFLANDPYEINNWFYSPEKYADYPRQLERAIELLGEKHYMATTLKAKKLYFEGYLIAAALGAENATGRFQDSVRALAKEKWLAAIALDPQAAYLYYSIGKSYERANVISTDSLVYWYGKAIELSPNWLLPYLDAANEFAFAQNNLESAEAWTLKAVKIAPESYNVLERLSWLYAWQERWDESLAVSEKMIAARPDLFNAYSTAGTTCLWGRKFEQAAAYFLKSRSIEPSFNNWAATMMVTLFLETRREKAALTLFDSIQSLAANPVIKDMDLGNFSWQYMIQGRFDEAEVWAKRQVESTSMASLQATAQSILGMVEIRKGNYEQGRAWMKKACETEPTLEGWRIFLNQYEAFIAEKEGRIADADSFFRKAFSEKIEFKMMNGVFVAVARLAYFRFLLTQKREKESLFQLEKMTEEEPLGWRGPLGYALFEAKKGHQKAALDWLEKSLDRWLPTREMAENEPLFLKIKKKKRFGDLMDRHFSASKN